MDNNQSKCKISYQKEIFSYIALLCSLSKRQAPKPLRETVKKHIFVVHFYFLLFRKCVMHTEQVLVASPNH